ncbi:hypothetical protein [Corynebacterium macginleyi]|uniref:hypothetical protein n=1 Tax=Corynebacterium macginleyi TaxID=38290 RepID=UPI001EE4ACDC
MTSIGVTRVCNPTPHPCHQEAVGGSVTGPDDADYKVAINRLGGLAFIAIHSPWSSEYSRVRMCTLQPLPVNAVRIEVIKDWPAPQVKRRHPNAQLPRRPVAPVWAQNGYSHPPPARSSPARAGIKRQYSLFPTNLRLQIEL